MTGPSIELVHAAKILIVDDMRNNIVLLERILEQEGYTNVFSTTDPRETLPLYEEHRFDLILLDLNMPFMDGFQVMDQISEIIENDYLPVLVLSAQTEESSRLRALGMGAKDFIGKPFQRAEVVQRIRNMLDVRILYNQQRTQSEELEIKVQERTQELLETQLEIVRRLGRAGEYRDNETGMHVIRMSKSCQRLALAMDLGRDQAELILNASPMHDIGKIGIPDQILLKPGKLDEAELAIIKLHPEIGASILGDPKSGVMRMAANIALTHHEKWNGSGYPAGLSGTNIPVAGRISALCDVFDALTSERPYKKAWPVADAIDFIAAASGSHFDPQVVQVFKDVLPDILDIRDAHADDGSEAHLWQFSMVTA